MAGALQCRVLILLCPSLWHEKRKLRVFLRTGSWRPWIEHRLGGHQHTGKPDQCIVDNADSNNETQDAHDRTYAGVARPNFILLPVHTALASSVSPNERVGSFPGSNKSRKQLALNTIAAPNGAVSGSRSTLTTKGPWSYSRMQKHRQLEMTE